jgi:asparagine synthase (glutamine-hydrolysing)
MSTIGGIFTPEKEEGKTDRSVLEMMVNAGKSSGTDEPSVFVCGDGSFGLAYRGPTTTGRAAASGRAACDSEQRIWVVSDGPVFNFTELAGHVSEKASIPPPQTQGELIAELFKLEGERAFRMFDGECAFALIDTAPRRLYLVRDAGGTKGIYYTLKDNLCCFAGELKAVLAAPCVGRELDEQGLCDYLTFLFVPPPRTILKEIRKLRPAGFACIDRNGCRLETYWNPLECPAVEGRDQSYFIEAFKEKFRRAVEKRCNCSGRVGIFLGGIDSAAIAGMASSAAPGRTHTITSDLPLPGGEGDKNLADLRFGRKTAEALGLEHHEFLRDPGSIMHAMARTANEVIDDLRSPFGSLPMTVATVARENNIPVGFVGEPALHFSSGVSPGWMKIIAEKWMTRRRWPGMLRRALAAGAEVAFLRGGPDEMDIAPRRELWRNFARGRELYWTHRPGFIGRGKRSILAPEVLRRVPDADSHHWVQETCNEFRKLRPDGPVYDMINYMDVQVVIGYLVRNWACSCAANGVELRCPYLDRELLEFAFAVPYRVKLSGKKLMIEKSVEGILPVEIIYRKKVGASVPTTAAMRPFIPRILKRAMDAADSEARSLFNYTQLQRLVHLCEEGKSPLWDQPRVLIAFFLWHRRWIEGKEIVPEELAAP